MIKNKKQIIRQANFVIMSLFGLLYDTFLLVALVCVTPLMIFISFGKLIYDLLCAMRQKPDHSKPEEKPDHKTVLITGATAGIGKLLAQHFAETWKDHCKLILHSMKDSEGLKRLAADLKDRYHCDVSTFEADVTDKDKMKEEIQKEDDASPIDLVVTNEFIADEGAKEGKRQVNLLDEEYCRRIMSINVEGVFNTIYPLIPRMQMRKKGQIAIVSSLSAFIEGTPYCMSKATIKSFGGMLRTQLKEDNIKVSVICPDFVDISDIETKKKGIVMKALMATPEVRTMMTVKALHMDRPIIAFPLHKYLLSYIFSSMPNLMKENVLEVIRATRIKLQNMATSKQKKLITTTSTSTTQ